jgi:hypothetical protein
MICTAGLSNLPIFLESIFQDPCPTLNGTRRATMPQVLTRRREPIHPSSQARSPAPTNPKTGSGSDHPGGRSPQLHCSISPNAQSPSQSQGCSISMLGLGTHELANGDSELSQSRPRSPSIKPSPSAPIINSKFITMDLSLSSSLLIWPPSFC